MNYLMRSYRRAWALTLGLIVVLVTLVTPLATSAPALAANADGPVYEEKVVCQPTVLPGWRPYRVGVDDSLESLALRAKVSVDELAQINCLERSAVKAGALLLLPAKLAAPAPTSTAMTVAVVDTSSLATNAFGNQRGVVTLLLLLAAAATW